MRYLQDFLLEIFLVYLYFYRSDSFFFICPFFAVIFDIIPTRRSAFTCVGWEVARCDLLRQVTLSSSDMGFL